MSLVEDLLIYHATVYQKWNSVRLRKLKNNGKQTLILWFEDYLWLSPGWKETTGNFQKCIWRGTRLKIFECMVLFSTMTVWKVNILCNILLRTFPGQSRKIPPEKPSMKTWQSDFTNSKEKTCTQEFWKQTVPLPWHSQRDECPKRLMDHQNLRLK